MIRGKREGILIAGGGIAGCLAALALARLRPDVPLLIVDERERFGGEGFHWLLDSELDEAQRALVAPLMEQGWPGFYIAFPGFTRNLKAGLAGFSGDALHHAIVATLRPDQYRLGTRIVAVRDDALELEGGETIRADGALDTRGVANLSMLDLLYETRVERMACLTEPHRLDRPLLLDAGVDQSAGFSFVQAFPIDEKRLRIAKVLVSERAQPDEAADARLDHYLLMRGWQAAAVEARSVQSRPLPMDGDFAAFWRIGGARVARLGLRGGLVQPVTGRTAPDAIRAALLLAGQHDFSGEALHDLFETHARQAWRSRELARSVNAALAAAAPDARRPLMERLYRLEPGPLLRFLTERPRLLDRRLVQKALRA